MSDDLVKRSDAMQVALWFSTSELKYSRQFVKRRVMEIPTAEPKHGEWIDFKNGWKCNACEKWNSEKSKFCPNCGARMKGTVDEISCR